ncbi:MAG TPA: hypothetical protein VGE43_09050 [Acidimicrobiales bacterium]|jgi:hypothetical protein
MPARTTIEVTFGAGPPVVIGVPAGTCADLRQLQVVAGLCLAARRAGGRPRVVGAPDRVRELLELAGFDATDLLDPGRPSC